MTNEEIKETIVYIATTRTFTDSFGEEMGIDIEVAKGLADALIAAGLKFDTVVSHTATFDLAQLEYINSLERWCAQAEHRAEVAERALKLAEKLGKLCAPAKDYIKQAEKELAEEGKSENN